MLCVCGVCVCVMLVFMFYIYGIKAFLFVFTCFELSWFLVDAFMKLSCFSFANRQPFICVVFSPIDTHLCYESPVTVRGVCGWFRLVATKSEEKEEEKAPPILACHFY